MPRDYKTPERNRRRRVGNLRQHVPCPVSPHRCCGRRLNIAFLFESLCGIRVASVVDEPVLDHTRIKRAILRVTAIQLLHLISWRASPSPCSSNTAKRESSGNPRQRRELNLGNRSLGTNPSFVRVRPMVHPKLAHSIPFVLRKERPHRAI